ncbi:uncharacterized protein C8R40DRAFT_1171748 [Lentinula edodes]|uniref:uncharacterized protein n=1 Tax=Lentinula edodes TaxID=5353 RepID=UPI001E8CD8F4|nr:uncharacterized protein C8R40DRAFT_1171748 [Lentinula edodes]KAH7874213.1 hypothetical protein C8R40DRAFT_1171748 [Lentinula edodes]
MTLGNYGVKLGITFKSSSPQFPYTFAPLMEVDFTLGFIDIGVLVSGILFGIFTMQVYIYHRSFSEDPGWIKYGLVNGMWLLELAHTICEFDALYNFSVSHYGDPTVFLVYPIPFVAVTLFDALIATLAQGNFTYRIAKLTGPPMLFPSSVASSWFAIP